MRFVLSLVASVVVVACSAPEPYVAPAGHPADPNAATLPVPPFDAALSDSFEIVAPPAAEPGDADLYRCPMHPEVVRKEPGRCPICGMALEKIKKPEHQHEEGGR